MIYVKRTNKFAIHLDTHFIYQLASTVETNRQRETAICLVIRIKQIRITCLEQIGDNIYVYFVIQYNYILF